MFAPARDLEALTSAVTPSYEKVFLKTGASVRSVPSALKYFTAAESLPVTESFFTVTVAL